MTAIADEGCHRVAARRLGLDTHSEAVVFLRKDSPICRSEGFEASNRLLLRSGDRSVVATLYQVEGAWLALEEAALSDSAWNRLGLVDGAQIDISHPEPLDSLSLVRSRIYGHALDRHALGAVINDIAAGEYTDVHISAFVTACAARALSQDEILSLTHAMVDVGDRLHWKVPIVADKHSVGGLPGNRTTPIVVAIAAANGLTMPKTSSRAITSPSGTADTMEVLAPVDLDIETIHRVVEQEGGCIAWGGSIRLSPADDILIRVERALDIDTEGQMIASVLSKKVAAGATRLVLDMPVGPTAKVRSEQAAASLALGLERVASAFGIVVKIVRGDGAQPIGRGIGPALEAQDVLLVLQNAANAPLDLKHRALELAGSLLELTGAAKPGDGEAAAARTLSNGAAWAKFQRICEAQGGMRIPPVAAYRRDLLAPRSGRLAAIDNRRIAKLAKLAGAPEAKAAGIYLHARLGDIVVADEPLCTVHAEATGELAYALNYGRANLAMFAIEDI